MQSSSMSVTGSAAIGANTSAVVPLTVPSDAKYRLERVTAAVSGASPFDGYISIMMRRTGSEWSLRNFEPVTYMRRYVTVECDHLLLPGDDVVVRLTNATASSGAVVVARAWFRRVE